MKTFELKASLRENVGKKATLKLRRSGQVPCVLYGGEKNVHFSAPVNEFRKLIYTPNVYLVNVNCGDSQYTAVLKDIQFDPVTDSLVHIDFKEVVSGKPVTIGIPVKLHGFAAGVREGGKLVQEERYLRVKALAEHHIDEINIDVTELGLNKTIKVADVKIEGATIVEPMNKVVAAVKETRASREAAEAEGEKGEEK